MDNLIRYIFHNVVETSENIRVLDKAIEVQVAKLVTLYPDSDSIEKLDEIADVALDMAAEVREESFILGFRYAIALWTEALSEDRGKGMGNDLKYERILSLYNQLSSGKTVYKEEEALRYGVTERSIQRDIDSLRAFLANRATDGDKRQEIVYDRSQKGYHLIIKEQKTLGVQEIFTIIKILLGSKGLIKEEMQPLLEKMLDVCDGEEGYKELKALVANEMMHYTGPSHGKKALEKVWSIAQAINHQNLLEIQYKKAKTKEMVHRIVEPVGLIFSEYYFYMLAYIRWEDERKQDLKNPTVYRIDRVESIEMKKEHFHVSYSKKFSESKFREQAPFMYGGEMKRVKFWYSGPSVDVILDRIPTAKVIEESDGRYLIAAEVIGDGIEIWLRAQGEDVEILY